ncbi:signal protein PDZ [Georgenia sp. TF02-10]|uniref:YlbL family protein n=1 Tax=Georgenia sp. TF02-10 TaxID=2917725 RepID=UPI001FA75EBB|nr:S16 family serine protease [Georgenia sp. TF02-10]UNX53939.1 signal protein PDZ [Georgenia sp. TF02-10]
MRQQRVPAAGREDPDRRAADPAAVAGPAAPGPAAVGRDAAAAPGTDREPVVSRRSVTLVVAGAVLALLGLVAAVVPLPYAVEGPGPTVDTLGEHDGDPLIHVDGAETYPTAGDLLLTTVTVSGGPGYPVTAVDVLAGWLSAQEVVLPVESVFPDGRTRKALDAESTAEMTSSQTNATVAALAEVGHEVPMVLTVDQVLDGSGADGVVRPGDVVTSIQAAGEERREVTTFADLTAVLATTPAGTEVALGVQRDGAAQVLDLTTTADPARDRGSVLGVVLMPDVELPVQVELDIEDIGGPSAGLMFALGIVDVLTPGPLTGGASVAGTGTIGLDGEVGAIGGIRQKLLGAARDGARWFLAPEANCAEVAGHVPAGLDVVAVDTLAEAHAAVAAIAAGDGDRLPGCPAS